jgi:hypothetical protein
MPQLRERARGIASAELSVEALPRCLHAAKRRSQEKRKDKRQDAASTRGPCDLPLP